MFNNRSFPKLIIAIYWLWAFSFPYVYKYLPLLENPTGTTFIGFWIIWLGVGGLMVVPFGEWMARKTTNEDDC